MLWRRGVALGDRGSFVGGSVAEGVKEAVVPAFVKVEGVLVAAEVIRGSVGGGNRGRPGRRTCCLSWRSGSSQAMVSRTVRGLGDATGWTQGCSKCRSMQRGERSTAGHSTACRERALKELGELEEFSGEVKKANARVDEALAREIGR